MSHLLAIVIPYFKFDFFEATLQSLANQTDKRFHVYIGDDASKDNCTILLNKYKGDFNFTYKRFDKNLGSISLVQQWERCMHSVNEEEWLMLLGDDDVLGDNVVAAFYNYLDEINKEHINVIRYATQVIDGKGVALSKKHYHPVKETAIDFLIRKYKGGTRSSLSEYIFRKDVVDTIKFKDFPLAWSSDVLGVIEFSHNGYIYTINDALVFFRLSDKNITGQKDSVEKNEAWFQFYDYLLYNYGKQYPKKLQNILFDRLEKVQLNHKKTPKRWLKIFKLYFVFSQYSRFFTIGVKIKKSFT
ncbi:glycosyltransferase [Zhouia sp. PK063]|uniref:glycosyltransferase n=1 Tax=Zhouia sp. PK063 TaxID=3373602 RepID=UPI0037BC9DF9